MKKGAAHIEIILAFVLFVGFVGFALYFFSPTDSRLVDTTLIYAFDEIEKNTSVRVELFGVKINTGNIPSGTTKIAINTGDTSNKNSYVEDKDGKQIDSYKDGLGIVYMVYNGEDFVYIKLSEDIDICDGCGLLSASLDDTYYTIASSDSRMVISEKRFRKLFTVYDNNYFRLKEDFNLPNRVNFGALLNLGSSEVNGEDINIDRPTPEGLDVFSESKRKEVLRAVDKNGKIEFAELKVRIW